MALTPKHPVPARFVGKRPQDTYHTPEKIAERAMVNAERMREAKRRYQSVPVRIFPSVKSRSQPGHRWAYQALRGVAWVVNCPEPVDAQELLADLGRFLKAWRPSRLRSRDGRQSAEAAFNQYERAGHR